MFGTNRQLDTSEAGPVDIGRRRGGRSMGPFTGGQLTAIVVTFAVLLLFPVGAWAALSFTNVAITDPGGVNRAKVDSTGALSVGDGSGSLTIDGTVTARSGLPTKPITITETSVYGTATLYGPVSKPFGITSLHIYDGCPTGTTGTITFQSTTSTGGLFRLVSVLIPGGTDKELVFPTPLVITPPLGGTASLVAYPDTDCSLLVSGVGIQS